ncbi:hypothetical protein GCM10027445_64740 [Amycolatopsis endophytica]
MTCGALAAVALLTACDTGDEAALSADALRQAATRADPAKCPVDFDVPAALTAAGVDGTAEFDSAEAQTSATTTPADDPLTAQQRDGMTPLDAVAGTYIECDYRVGGDTLSVRLVTTRVNAAVNLLVPQIVQDARLRLTDVDPLIAPPPAAGEVRRAGSTVAVGGLAVDGGDGALMVSSKVPALHDDALAKATGSLLFGLKF